MNRLLLIGVAALAQACFSPVGEPDGGVGGGAAAGGAGGSGTGGSTGGSGGASGGGSVDPCIDADHDGYVPGGGAGCPGKLAGDCDDTNAQIHPGAIEQCFNGRDDNCNGLIDGSDPECMECMGGPGCINVFQCQLGQTFCPKTAGPSCCTVCPPFVGDCADGYHVAPLGTDPYTGCQTNGCVPYNNCPQGNDPQCATSGKTYPNTCVLNSEHATLLHAGECLPGEGLDCGHGSDAGCGPSGTLYCRDACPICDDEVLRCTKVGVCVYDLDCPAGAPPPPIACLDGGVPHARCVLSACQYSCQ
jgi:hypothetical protein